MRNLSPALAAHLASGATTLCSCWKLTRRDGVVLGFTDRDRDLAFDGVTYEATAGFTATDIKSSIGLSVDNLDVSSAFSSNHLDEAHLANGLYDDASVEIWRVNWADTSQRLLERKGSIGEVRRSGPHFSAEIRGLAHYLNQPKGRVYQFSCDADLGDISCKVATAAYTAVATIADVVDDKRIVVSDLSAFDADWFSRGLATFVSGALAGTRTEIRRHAKLATADRLDLWQILPIRPAVGGTLSIVAGCDKTFAACRTKFDNGVNFRGFPHIPGNSFVTSVARQSDVNNGTALR